MLRRVLNWWRLMRGDRPIGFFLLLWPTLWALWLAAQGVPDFRLLAIFVVGCFLMRSAGCVINDYADRNIDRHVARTRDRPLVTGAVKPREARWLAAGLIAAAATLVLMTNLLTVKLALLGLALAAIYPFTKRWFRAPQLLLGLAFAWGIPMAFAATLDTMPLPAWALFLAAALWTIAYDTCYAMADVEDDRRIGIGSMALFLGRADRIGVAMLQIATLSMLAVCGTLFGLGWIHLGGLLVAGGLFVHQQWLLRNREPAMCTKAFLNNNWVGAVVAVSIALDLAIN